MSDPALVNGLPVSRVFITADGQRSTTRA